jgi:hypothetical protein
MSIVPTGTRSILAAEHKAKREEIVGLLTRAYWMEVETVMSYLANAAQLDGVRAREVAEALDEEGTGCTAAWTCSISSSASSPRAGQATRLAQASLTSTVRYA